jgi:predicted sulfurtransferase
MHSISRDVLLIIMLAIILALCVNMFRKDGIPLVAEKEFEILVPCSDPMDEAAAINEDHSLISDPATLLIDVRSKEEFDKWHLPQSINQPFDWLAEQDEVSRKAAGIAKTVARSGKHHVIIYGDGENPDAGEHWAALLSKSGIKNVAYISGGAKSLLRLKTVSGEKE